MFELVWLLKEKGIRKANHKGYENIYKEEEKILYVWHKWKKKAENDKSMIRECQSLENFFAENSLYQRKRDCKICGIARSL
jgi:uncharacterized protein YabN with tetrapyrrole methylase and pyrophosphatase domain